MFETRVLREILGPKRVELLGDGKKLRNFNSRDLYFSINFIKTLNSERVKWVGRVVRMSRR